MVVLNFYSITPISLFFNKFDRLFLLKSLVQCWECYCYTTNFKPFTPLSLLIRYLCCINISLKVVFYNYYNGFIMSEARVYTGCIPLKDQIISFSWENFDLLNGNGVYVILITEVEICPISYKQRCKVLPFSPWAIPFILILAFFFFVLLMLVVLQLFFIF